MRHVYAKVLTVGLLALVASPAFAQPPGGRTGMFQPNAAMLLRDEKVQTELKLTDDQKAELKKIADKYGDDIRKAFTDMDTKKAGELMKAASADAEKILKDDQTKRLKQLELQAAVQFSGPGAFSKDEVKAALKLTDKQEKDLQAAEDEIKKDSEELLKDAGMDREKRGEARKKIMAMQKEAMDKATAGFTDDQKKAWTDLTGEKFEFSPFGGFRPGGPRPDDKPKDK